jgi:Zn-dependent peptidase ImmA (M78 family)
MGIGKIESLGDVRQRLLGFSLEGAARLSGVSLKRLSELEGGAPASVWELESLSRVYGVDADILAESPIHVAPSDVVTALASSEEFGEIGDAVRSHVVSAARAARDLIALRELLDPEAAAPGLPRIQYDVHAVPHRQGANAAATARRDFGVPDGPIHSMRDWLSEAIGAITVLYARLGPTGPAGLAFAGPSFGPAIVLNLDGKNRNPCVRRFSLVHELCHLLVDWTRPEPLAQISGYDTDAGRAREQRANAFAMRFLCPETSVEKLSADPIVAARTLVRDWGVHYGAARLYLLNVRNMQLPPVPPASFGATGTEAVWESAEAPDGVDNFPLHEVAAERRTDVALYAATAYSLGRLQRDAFAEYLDVTPAADLESVLDFFDLDPPDESATAA